MPELKRNLRIVNGEAIRLPYQLQLRHRVHGFHWCGGVLISPKLAITALHCLDFTNIVTGRKATFDWPDWDEIPNGLPINKLEVLAGHFWKNDKMIFIKKSFSPKK